MSTSNKDFKIKNGLIVQGTTATVNGENILTSASNIDDLNDVNTSGVADGYALVYDIAEQTWVASEVAGGGGTSTEIGETPPVSPNAGDLWLDSSTGSLYVYYADINSSQWIAVKTAATTPSPSSRLFQADTAPAAEDVTENDFWFNTTTGNLYIWYISNGVGQWISVQTDITVAISSGIDELSDVEIATPSNNEALVYDSTSQRWENKNFVDAGFYTSPNYIINGAFDIWQRGTTFTNPGGAGNVYTADRWQAFFSANGTVTQETSFVPSGTRYGARVSATATSATNVLFQLIDTNTTSPLAGKTVTVSAYVAGTNGKQPGISITYTTTVDASLFSVNSSVTELSSNSVTTQTGAFQRLVKTFTVPADAKTLRIGLASEAMVNGEYLIWSAAQLEEGSTATPFRRNANSPQGELAACQRYYYRITATNLYGQMGMGIADASNQATIMVKNPVTLRVPATAVEHSGTGVWDSVNFYTVSSAVLKSGHSSRENSVVTITVAANPLFQFRPYFLVGGNNVNSYIGFSAEL